MIDLKRMGSVLESSKSILGDRLNIDIQQITKLFEDGVSIEKVCELYKAIPKEKIEEIYKMWKKGE